MDKFHENLYIRAKKIITYFLWIIQFVKWSIICIIILMLCTPYMRPVKEMLYAYIAQSAGKIGFNLEQIDIYGSKNFPIHSLISSLEEHYQKPILKIDIAKLREAAEKNPWIANICIARKLPNKIHIYIEEKEPIASWQKDENHIYLIDSMGRIITEGYRKDLLFIEGAGANVYAEDLKESLNKFPQINNNIKMAVRHGKRRWDLVLNNNVTVQMPDRDYIKILPILNNIIEEDQLTNIKSIDFRIKDKYYLEKK